MKLIGYWIRSLSDPEFPPPQELVTGYDPGTRQLIADYLDSGSIFATYRGISWCRFFCDHPMGHAELTDGAWVWPQDLSHYVRDHNVRLPDSFIERIRTKPKPVDIPEGGWLHIDPDVSFWITWCTEHRSNSLASRIEDARAKADAEVRELTSKAIAQREVTDGVSNNACLSSSCSNRALTGRALCAACILARDGSLRFDEPYMNLRHAIDA